MPIRKASDYSLSGSSFNGKDEIREVAIKEIKKYEEEQKTSSVNLCIVLIIIIFAIGVAYSVFSQMNEKFTITDKDAKTCLVDFQMNKCDALNLSDLCKDIYQCVQKEVPAGILTKILFMVEVGYEKVINNLIMLFLYQIVKSIQKKWDPD